jgi:hypothetical protein
MITPKTPTVSYHPPHGLSRLPAALPRSRAREGRANMDAAFDFSHNFPVGEFKAWTVETRFLVRFTTTAKKPNDGRPAC